MAVANKRKTITLTTPKGRFSWPKLNEPDYGTAKYPKKNGVYSVKLILKEDDVATQKFIKQLQPILDSAKAKAEAAYAEMKVKARKELEEKNGPGGIKGNKLFSTIYDEETEEPTGEIEFKFEMPAKVEIKKGPKAGKTLTFKPVIVNSVGSILNNPPAIWGGTLGVVSFEVDEEGYFVEGSGMYGVKLKLLGVQILELKSGGERSASSLGFKAQDGYDAIEDGEAAAEETTEEETSTDAPSDQQEDF